MSFPRSQALALLAATPLALPFSLALALPFAIPLALPAAAGERTPFEIVAGWEVERDRPEADGNACLMSRSYKDKDDDDAENAVVFKRYGADVAIVLGYENWEWNTDQKVKVPFVIGSKVVDAKSTWIGDGTILKGVFPGSIVPNMLGAKTIELRIKGAEAEFEIPGFAQGYEALLRCDAAPPAAKVAEAPAPAQAEKEPLRMERFLFVTRRAERFGDIAAREAGPFAVGNELRAYLEVNGQTLTAAGDGQRTFHLALDYEIVNANRVIVAGQKSAIDQEFTLSVPGQPETYFNVGLGAIDLAPGPYTLALTLSDKRDGRRTSASLPFTVVAAPAAPETSPAQSTAFFVGLLAQRTIANCDFATTTKERTALDAKVAALKPQDAVLEQELRSESTKKPPACPDSPEMEAKYRNNIRELVEMSPEAYVAQMEKRMAERQGNSGGTAGTGSNATQP